MHGYLNPSSLLSHINADNVSPAPQNPAPLHRIIEEGIGGTQNSDTRIWTTFTVDAIRDELLVPVVTSHCVVVIPGTCAEAVLQDMVDCAIDVSYVSNLFAISQKNPAQ
jgi:hypothetical protein